MDELATHHCSCAEAIYAREISHRTANLLQTALSAVNLGRRGQRLYMDEAALRLSGAAELNRLLGMRGSELVDLGTVLEQIGEAALIATGADDWVLTHYDCDPVLVDLAMARPLFLAAAELLGNSVRHAFPEERGSILVALRDRGETMMLAIQDDGVCAGWWRPGGQGKGIVDDLASLIGASVERSITPGGSSCVTITMPTLSAAAATPAGAA